MRSGASLQANSSDYAVRLADRNKRRHQFFLHGILRVPARIMFLWMMWMCFRPWKARDVSVRFFFFSTSMFVSASYPVVLPGEWFTDFFESFIGGTRFLTKRRSGESLTWFRFQTESDWMVGSRSEVCYSPRLEPASNRHGKRCIFLVQSHSASRKEYVTFFD